MKSLSSRGDVVQASAEAEQVIQGVQSRWNRAAESWNVDQLTGIYAHDAMMFGGRPGLSAGIEGIRAYFASYSDQIAFTELELVEQHIVALTPDIYLAQGFCNFKFRLMNGENTGTRMRTTWVLRRTAGEWLIQQHHFSTIPERPPIR